MALADQLDVLQLGPLGHHGGVKSLDDPKDGSDDVDRRVPGGVELGHAIIRAVNVALERAPDQLLHHQRMRLITHLYASTQCGWRLDHACTVGRGASVGMNWGWPIMGTGSD